MAGLGLRKLPYFARPAGALGVRPISQVCRQPARPAIPPGPTRVCALPSRRYGPDPPEFGLSGGGALGVQAAWRDDHSF